MGLVPGREDGRGRLQVGRLVCARGQEAEDLSEEVDYPVVARSYKYLSLVTTTV